MNNQCADEIVKFLINWGADLYLTDSEGLTGAYHALAFDHIDVVKSLPLSALYTENLIFLELSKNENENDNVQNLQKKEDLSNDLKVDLNVNIRSAFHIVCQWGSVKSLEYLLKLNNLELNVIKRNYFFMNDDNNNKNELKIILNNHMVIVDDIVLEKNDCLIEKNVLFKINCFLADGTSPIHLVARYNHINCLELLMNNNADYNSKDYNNDTPLDIANRWGRQAIVDFLSKYFEK
jgi:ankyrin repeat protein